MGHLQDGPTARRPQYRLIQVLRAVAALMVVVQHAGMMLQDRNKLPLEYWVNGGAGADLFFVISGFVMTLSSAPLAGTLHPARTFLARRLERVVPMYWIVTTVKVVTLLAVPALALNALGTAWNVISSYLFLPSDKEPLIVVGWTLNFEMLFYVLFAVALAMRVRPVKLVGPVVILLAAAWFIPHQHAPVIVDFYERLFGVEFLFGMLLATAVRKIERLPNWLGWLSLMAGMSVLCLWTLPNFYFWRGLLWGPPAAMVVAASIVLEKRWGQRMSRWVLELGDASYSIYLIHGFALPVIGLALAKFGSQWRGVVPVSMAVMVMFSAGLGVAVYRFVEVPIMRWFKGRRRTAVPVVG